MSQSNAVYRDDELFVSLRLEELRAHVDRLQAADRHRRKLWARQTARVLGGVVGIAGAVTLVALVVHRWLTEAGLWLEDGVALTGVLVASTPMAIAAWGASRLLFGLAPRTRRMRQRASTPREELQSLERWVADSDSDARRSVLATLSLALPLAAIALLAPLTLHLLMRLGYAALFLESTPFAVRDFDTWIVLSMIIVPHAHLVVVACAARYARALVRNFPYRPENAGVGGALASVGYATAMSAVPGIVLIGIPPALTAVTGLVFIPAMYALARHWIAGDRRIEARCASDSSQAGNAALT